MEAVTALRQGTGRRGDDRSKRGKEDRLKNSDEERNRSVSPIDIEDAAEAARQTIMGRLLTRQMGALVPAELRECMQMQVLDVGCGPGGWVHDVAYHYPKAEVVGIDLSELMLDLARSGAKGQNLNNATFERMDATRPLRFSDGTFDLVQVRFANSFLLGETWPALLRECVRVLRTGGILRVVEADGLGLGTSPDLAFRHLLRLLGLSWERDGLERVQPVTAQLPRWMQEAGCVQLRERPHLLTFSAPFSQEDEVQEEQHRSMCESLETAFWLLLPYIERQQHLARASLEHRYEHVRVAMRQPQFRGQLVFLEVVGITPARVAHAQGHEAQAQGDTTRCKPLFVSPR